MTKIVTSGDIGAGLVVANNKLTVDVDNSTIRVNEQGKLVATGTTDIHLQNVTASGTVLTFDLNEGEDKTLDLGEMITTAVNEKINATPKGKTDDEIVALVKGDPVESLGGDVLGYLVKAS